MFRSFAVVPAAGRSERMGSPKLLLPLGDRPVIDHVLAAWTASAVTRTIIVVRDDDDALIERCQRFPVDLVTPAEPPRDMKASVELALAHITERYAPAGNDAWLLGPADLPRLAPQVINLVLRSYDPAQPVAVAPVHRGERGHPTLLPWAIARDVRNLLANEGVNSLVARTSLREIECELPGVLDDLDAPAAYARLAAQWGRAGEGDETAEPAPVF